MSRTYDEGEAQKILAKAAELELARRNDPGGVTLAELEQAAESAGIDRALVRQAARTLDTPGPDAQPTTADELISTMTVAGVSPDVVARRLFTRMAREHGEVGSQSEVGEGFMWQTQSYGKAYEPGQGRKVALAVFPAGDGAEIVLRENPTGAGVPGVLMRILSGGGLGFVLGIVLIALLGLSDEAAFFSVLLTTITSAAIGWGASVRWWSRQRQALHQAQEQSLRQLAASLDDLPRSEP